MPIFYEIKKVQNEFSVTFHIQNADQKKEFHDKVAIKISEAGPFIGGIYTMFRGDECNDEYKDNCGVLRLKKDT